MLAPVQPWTILHTRSSFVALQRTQRAGSGLETPNRLVVKSFRDFATALGTPTPDPSRPGVVNRDDDYVATMQTSGKVISFGLAFVFLFVIL